MENLLELFEEQRTCDYRGEIYHVRDNGAIYRAKRPSYRKRPLDEIWTFGSPDKQKGYMRFASETVHRIVATAFHGDQPSKKHVVDHIDTNKKNNRPENLRWITRLENLLLNPITLSRIIYKYGSIDNFLDDPTKPLNGELAENFDWMRTVTKEESENTRRNLMSLGRRGRISKSGALGEWVFSNLSFDQKEVGNELNDFIQSLSPNAVQKKWKTPTRFPLCPLDRRDMSLDQYSRMLKKGKVFSINRYGQSIVFDYAKPVEKNELIIMCRQDGRMKPWSLIKIYTQEGKFVHESVGTFFRQDGAQKNFNIALGMKWKGGDTFDDLIS